MAEPIQENLSATIGKPAPNFTLVDLAGIPQTLSDYQGQIVVINFWSAECPHAARCDRQLSSLLPRWGETVTILSIACNANESREMLSRVATDRHLPIVLLDSERSITDMYGATTTPHFFVIDQRGILRYQGSFDDVSFRKPTPTQVYLVQAVEALLHGVQPEPSRTSPYGCTIVRYSG